MSSTPSQKKIHSTIDKTYEAQADRLKQAGRPVPTLADLHTYADKEHGDGGQGGTVMDMMNELSVKMEKGATVKIKKNGKVVDYQIDTSSNEYSRGLNDGRQGYLPAAVDSWSQDRYQNYYAGFNIGVAEREENPPVETSSSQAKTEADKPSDEAVSLLTKQIRDAKGDDNKRTVLRSKLFKAEDAINEIYNGGGVSLFDQFAKDFPLAKQYLDSQFASDAISPSLPEKVNEKPETPTVNNESNVELPDTQTFKKEQLEGVDVSAKRKTKKGEVVVVQVDAHKELTRIDDDLSNFEKLLNCMGGK